MRIPALAGMMPVLSLIVACASATPPIEAQTAPRAASRAPASAFADYRSFREQEIAPWRASNDLAGRLGGWKAFAADNVPDIQPGPEEGRR